MIADGKPSHLLRFICALAAVFSDLRILSADFSTLLERVENENDGDLAAKTELKHKLVRVQSFIEALRSTYEDGNGDVDDDDRSLLFSAFLCADSYCQYPCDQTALVGFSQGH